MEQGKVVSFLACRPRLTESATAKMFQGNQPPAAICSPLEKVLGVYRKQNTNHRFTLFG